MVLWLEIVKVSLQNIIFNTVIGGIKGNESCVERDIKKIYKRKYFDIVFECNSSCSKSFFFIHETQVDFESMKFENKRLKEDTEDLNAELEELSKLKSIVEKNLEESLVSLQQEREQKHALKKELDTRIQSESMFTLQSLAGLGLGELNMGLGSKDKSTNNSGAQDDHVGSDSPALRQIEADFTSPNKGNARQQPAPNSGLVGDLFSEIHLTEVRKLETILEQTEIEKSKLQQQLEDATLSLEAAKKEIEEQKEKITQMKAHLSAMASMTSNDLEAEVDDEDVDPDHPEIGTMKKNLKQQELRYAAALKQISELQVCALQTTVQLFWWLLESLDYKESYICWRFKLLSVKLNRVKDHTGE